MSRRRWKAAALAAGGALVLALAVLFAMTPDVPDRGALVLTFVSFGVALVAAGLLGWRPARPPATATRRGSVRAEGTVVPALEIPYSTYKQWLAVIAMLGFLGMGVGILLGLDIVLGVICLVTFVPMFALGVRGLVTGSKAALSERGVHLHAAGADLWIPWDEIELVWISEESNASFLAIDGTNGPRVEGRRWARALARANRYWADIGIPLDVIGVDPEALERAVERLAEDPAARRGVPDGVPELSRPG